MRSRNRVISLPSFTAAALRRRLAIMSDHSLDALVFRRREGTPLTTANVRRQHRKVLSDRHRGCQSHLGEGSRKRPRYEVLETFPLRDTTLR